jgi:hypothetical protein
MPTIVEGVFSEAINRRAFFDKVVLSLWGVKKNPSGPGVGSVVPQPIGGRGRKYATNEHGVLLRSGNSYDVKYGLMQLTHVLPPLVLTIRSDHSPVTLSVLQEGIEAVSQETSRISVSYVELTFDFNRLPIDFYRRNILASAHRFTELRDQYGRQTYYFGGPTSPVQICVYEKAPQAGVTRLEFRFRRSFLHRHGINTMRNLGNLRTLLLQRWLRVREVDESAVEELERRLRREDRDDVRQRILTKWMRDLRLRESIPATKRYFRLRPEEITNWSPVEGQLLAMQWALIC